MVRVLTTSPAGVAIPRVWLSKIPRNLSLIHLSARLDSFSKILKGWWADGRVAIDQTAHELPGDYVQIWKRESCALI